MKLNRTLTASSVAAAALTATAVLAAPAISAPTGATTATTSVATDTSKASLKATALEKSLGSKTAGVYLDAKGQTVATVTTKAAAAEVTAAGAVAKIVTRSASDLNKAKATLDATAKVAGSAWAVDPATNQVLVSVDSTVTGTKLATVKAAVAKLGSAARLESVPGVFTAKISGGQAIYAGGSRCSLGFNVRSGSTYYFLTAGHCTNISATWRSSSNGTVLGTRSGTSFPGNDYGIVRYTGTATHPSAVYTYNGSQTISTAATPAVGATVYRSGSTTGVHSGRVTALNSTVNYAEGSVSGLIRTTVCAEPGDSGGSLYSGSVAHGLTSGGSGNCSSGGVTYFQPVVEPMGVYGVTVGGF